MTPDEIQIFDEEIPDGFKISKLLKNKKFNHKFLKPFAELIPLMKMGKIEDCIE